MQNERRSKDFLKKKRKAKLFQFSQKWFLRKKKKKNQSTAT